MKTVLCYGDSITWGTNPADGARLPFEERWTGVLQAGLAPGVRVVDEGLPGRTTNWDSPFLADRNGGKTLPLALETHAPIDVFVLLLGTNDLWTRFNFQASDIAASSMSLIWTVQRSMAGPGGAAPGILLIAPPPLGVLSPFMKLFYDGRQKVSRQLGAEYKKVSAIAGCGFLDAGKIVKPSRADGVHPDASAHKKLGLAVKNAVAGLLTGAK